MATDRELHRRDDKPGKAGVAQRQAGDDSVLSRSERERINREVNRELWDGPHFERSGGQRGRDQDRSSGLDS